jgi:zinc and cadmium transporter
MLAYILLATFLASIVSLFLVAFFLLYKNIFKNYSFHLVSFAAGALLTTGFLDTMPEAIQRSKNSYLVITIFIALFFLVEKVLLGMHHRHPQKGREGTLRMPLSFLLFGDALHNFIDGVSIASTFLVSFPLGIVTSVAVFIHEIPHELGDFGILIHMGYERAKVLGFNALTGLGAICGAIGGFYLGGKIDGLLPIFLSLTTANFVYLSLSDLIPEVQEKSKGSQGIFHAIFFLLGILFIALLTSFVKV